ncbi:MAG TPA: TfoX/Sxy family protein [Candidatus Dormibacteraeota bacterium]|nr:TfoX/Sxy family protein [Candidatus Dormibacteraeota bacterium]
MATRQSIITYLLDQIGSLQNVRTRKMFGEYCIYVEEKPTAFVCDDELFVKPTEAGRAKIGTPELGQPYPGAKPHFWITADRWDDRAWLCDLLAATADALPMPKPRVRR